MKMNFKYEDRALVLPSSVSDLANKATKRDLQIILKIAADMMNGGSFETDVERLASEFNCKKSEIEGSLYFWREAGVISVSKDDTSDPKERKKIEQHKMMKPQAAPAKYNTEEIVAVLEGRPDLPGIIDECQNNFGKVFSSHEVRTLVGLIDYLGISSDYLLVLLSYCRKTDTRSMHYVEKLAYEMYNEGVYSAKELEARLTARERASSIEGKIRKLFGIKDRSLTTKEMQFIAKWASDFKYDMSVIKCAYEITIDRIKEPSLPYSNAILETWNKAGLRTLDDVQKYEAERSLKKPTAGGEEIKLGKSFDADVFFEKALERSLSEE